MNMNNTNEEYVSEPSNASQCSMILAYLEKGNTITSLEALNKFRCMRLASRIHDLREKLLETGSDMVIVSERIKVGEKYVARYKMEKKVDSVKNI